MSRTAESSAKSVSGGLEEEANVSVDNLPSSETAVSPRVSTVGTDENVSDKKESQMFVSDAGNHDYSAPGLDSLHWGGMKKRGDFDARSVASSMNAEKDDKSIYEEPAVGAVEEGDREDDDNEEPEEIVIGSLASSFAGAALSDGPGARHGEDDGGKHGSGGRGNLSPRDDIRRIASSQAPSTEADDASIRPAASEDGAVDLDDIALGGGGVSGEAAPSTSNSYPAGASMAPSSAAPSPRSPALPHSPLSRNSADFDGLRQRDDEDVPSARKMTLGEDEVEEHNGRNTSMKEDNRGNGITTATNPVPIASSQPYQSSLMRRVTGTAPDGGGGSEDNEGNDVNVDEGIAEYTSSAASMSATASAGASLTGSMPRTETSSVAPSARREDHGGEALGSEYGFSCAEETAVPSTNNNNNNSEMMPVHSNALPTSVAAAGVAAAEAGPPAPALPAVPGSPHAVIGPPRVHLGTEWEELFKGLLYIDGIDALGRPVVVINADAVPANMRSSALTYVKAHLEPLVSAGHYVIVFTARKAKLPSLWIMGAYQALPRPYRKNVQYVVLVRPTTFLKAVLRFMSPFVSKKAGRKIKVVEDVRELGEATGGEVTLHHLGQAFLEADAAAQEVEMAVAASP